MAFARVLSRPMPRGTSRDRGVGPDVVDLAFSGLAGPALGPLCFEIDDLRAPGVSSRSATGTAASTSRACGSGGLEA